MNPASKVWYILTLRCRESAWLQSESRERELEWHERWAVRSHLLSCRWCKRYRRFLGALDRAFADLADEMRLPEAARERVREAIARAS